MSASSRPGVAALAPSPAGTRRGTDETSQHMRALAKANRQRLAAAQLRRDLAAGTITFREAIESPDAASLTVERLLNAQRRWGVARVEQTCRAVPVKPWARVRDITPRQRDALVALVGGFATNCDPFRTEEL